jgi:hypothetical protein
MTTSGIFRLLLSGTDSTVSPLAVFYIKELILNFGVICLGGYGLYFKKIVHFAILLVTLHKLVIVKAAEHSTLKVLSTEFFYEGSILAQII